ncbi:MAG: sigma-70 family RNA polymerase sigma factor [Clostridia bacterium]|nr:sigma-70 family RNA polymerase sigma factor [Clostridia bacterium]
MEQAKAARLISEEMKNIFAFAMSRLYDKGQAEDLSQEIIVNVLASVSRLRDDDAFYAFLWKIAENTFKTYIRKRSAPTVEFDEGFMGTYIPCEDSPEDQLIHKEELALLRRELSLLSSQYRAATVAYYIHNKSCSEIANEQQISVEMVKYYLFKARKLLKEGMTMTRTFGEKSYDPGIFRFDYWGNNSNNYWQLFKHKLPGAIMLAAYPAPLSEQELAVELGVPTVYLEDELSELLRYEMLRKVGDKVQTNIIIFSDEHDKAIIEAAKAPVAKAAQQIQEAVDDLMPWFKEREYYGRDFGELRTKWALANLIMYLSMTTAQERFEKRHGSYPHLANGSNGFVFGYDNDYVNHQFNGIYGKCGNKDWTAWFSIENYRLIEKIQKFQPQNWHPLLEAICDAILGKAPDSENDQIVQMIEGGYISSDGERLSANFPVFSEEQFYGEMREKLAPLIDAVCDCMEIVCEIAVDQLKKEVPKALLPICEQVGYIHHHLDVMAFIMRALVESGCLMLPAEPTPLCIFGCVKV